MYILCIPTKYLWELRESERARPRTRNVVWDPHGEFSTSTGLEGNKEKTQTKTEEDDLISLFVVNELIFFHMNQDLHQAKSWFLMR